MMAFGWRDRWAGGVGCGLGLRSAAERGSVVQ